MPDPLSLPNPLTDPKPDIEDPTGSSGTHKIIKKIDLSYDHSKGKSLAGGIFSNSIFSIPSPLREIVFSGDFPDGTARSSLIDPTSLPVREASTWLRRENALY